MHTVAHTAPRPTASNRAHRRQLQTIPLRPGSQAGRPAQYALVQRGTETTTESGLAEHGCDANLSNLRFPGDILLISGSLKDTTTMLDDLTTATKSHGSQLHPTKAKTISNTTSKHRKNNMVAVQEMHTEVLLPEGKIKHLGQLITFKSEVQVELDHRIQCACGKPLDHAAQGGASRRVGPCRHTRRRIFQTARHPVSCHVLSWLDWSELRQIRMVCNHLPEYIHHQQRDVTSAQPVRAEPQSALPQGRISSIRSVFVEGRL